MKFTESPPSMSQDIQNTKYFTIMADEFTDTTNEEHIGICFRKKVFLKISQIS